MPNLMYVYPNFLFEFQCIGSECLNTCCSGWNIRLDENTIEYYEHLEGAFGDYLRQHLLRDEGTNKITAIRLNERKQCPFLNEKGLCQIQLECGHEHLSRICQNYPRYECGSDAISLIGILMSCDAVLNMLYNYVHPVYLCISGEKGADISTADDYRVLELVHFISWGMEFLQDTTVTFGIALATVLHVGFEIENPLAQDDLKTVDRVILQALEVQAQFILAKQELDKEESGQVAWQFIPAVIEVFCQRVCEEMQDSGLVSVLWNQDMLAWSREERSKFLYDRQKDCKKDEQHMAFLRRYAAVSFLHYSLSSSVSQYMHDFCILMILVEILPLSWADARELNEREYLARLSRLSRWFEQTNSLTKHMRNALMGMFSLDFYTYVIVLMELFDCP